jgi:hypothetical protein
VGQIRFTIKVLAVARLRAGDAYFHLRKWNLAADREWLARFLPRWTSWQNSSVSSPGAPVRGSRRQLDRVSRQFGRRNRSLLRAGAQRTRQSPGFRCFAEFPGDRTLPSYGSRLVATEAAGLSATETGDLRDFSAWATGLFSPCTSGFYSRDGAEAKRRLQALELMLKHCKVFLVLLLARDLLG